MASGVALSERDYLVKPSLGAMIMGNVSRIPVHALVLLCLCFSTGAHSAKTNCQDNIKSTKLHNEIIGTAGNDELVGTSCNDLIDGGDGNDTLRGLGNNDHLLGGTGDDYLDGGGTGGVDFLDGEDGSDTYFINGGAGTVVQDSGAGAGDWDVLTGNWIKFQNFSSANGIEEIAETRINGCGVDHLDFRGVVVPEGFRINTAPAESHCNKGKLKQGPDIVFGSDAGEVIAMGPEDDEVHAGGGSDVVAMSHGNDIVSLGAGADTYVTGIRQLGRILSHTTILDFSPGVDVLDLQELRKNSSFSRLIEPVLHYRLEASQGGTDIVAVDLESGEHTFLTLNGVQPMELHSSNLWVGAECLVEWR